MAAAVELITDNLLHLPELLIEGGQSSAATLLITEILRASYIQGTIQVTWPSGGWSDLKLVVVVDSLTG